jgi:hypothetical protein
MYNLRYHIASLVAVFLALSVGLLLGTVVVERGVLSAQKTSLVTGLQKDYDQLRSDIKVQTAKADTFSAFAAEVVPAVVKDGLLGKTIVVLADPGSGETVKFATDTISRAGGTAAVVTFSGPGLSLDDAGVRTAASAALALPEASLDQTRVATELAREWTTSGSPRTLTSALVKAGALRIEGFTATSIADGSVVASVWNDKPDATAIAIARSITGPGRWGVGVETSKRTTGLAQAARTASMSGVEDVDTSLGQVSLVWTVSGRVSGLFGTSKDADAPYPTPLFPAQ